MVALGLVAGLFADGGAAHGGPANWPCLQRGRTQSLLPCSLIKQLPAMGGSAWSDAADLLATGPLAQSPGNNPIAPSPSAASQTSNFTRSARNSGVLWQGGSCLSAQTCAKQAGVRPSLADIKGVASRIQLSQLRQQLALQGLL